MCVVTTDDNLIPWYLFTLAYLTSVTGDSGCDTVVTVRAFPCVPSCAGVVCDSVGAAIANSGTLLDAAAKTNVEKGII